MDGSHWQTHHWCMLWQVELSQWRAKLAASSREWAARNTGLRSETGAVRRHCAAVRSSMAHFQADQARELRQLCIER